MTEKNYNPKQKESKAMKKQKVVEKISVADAPKEKVEVKEEKANKEGEEKVEKETANGQQKEEKKETKKKQERIKKEEAVVDVKSVPVSTLHAVAVCKFISGKKITKALEDLNDVLIHRKAVPMKGEIAHKPGKGMSSGKYPKKATEYIIRVIKSLQANSNYNGIEEPVIVLAIANKASRPFGKFGRVHKKRTHIKLVAKEQVKKIKVKKNKNTKK